MLSAYSVPAISNYPGFDAYYQQQQLQAVNRGSCRQTRHHPYTRTSAANNSANLQRTNNFGHQFPLFRDKVRGYPAINGVNTGTLNCLEDYSYPTLGFLLPSNNISAYYASSINSIPSAEHVTNSSTATKTEEAEPHPFYRRQLLMTSQSRDGLTRTRDKYRVVYTEKQRKMLEEEYQKNSFISENRRTELAKETDLSERQIKFWFQNRRAKDKRTKKTTEHTRKALQNQEHKSPETNSPTIKATEDPVKSKHTEKPSCRNSPEYVSQPPIHVQPDINKDQQNFSYGSTLASDTDCQFSKLSSSYKSTMNITRSCRYEHTTPFYQTGTPSPTGSHTQKQYPVSPSEWTLTNQRPYLLDRVDMSPLFNGIQPGFDFRI